MHTLRVFQRAFRLIRIKYRPKRTRALIFDSEYDNFSVAVVLEYLRVANECLFSHASCFSLSTCAIFSLSLAPNFLRHLVSPYHSMFYVAYIVERFCVIWRMKNVKFLVTGGEGISFVVIFCVLVMAAKTYFLSNVTATFDNRPTRKLNRSKEDWQWPKEESFGITVPENRRTFRNDAGFVVCESIVNGIDATAMYDWRKSGAVTEIDLVVSTKDTIDAAERLLYSVKNIVEWSVRFLSRGISI